MAPNYKFEDALNGKLSFGNQKVEGFWPQTASIDWCEENYEISRLICEFWNSISNLAFIIPPLIQWYKLRNCLPRAYALSYGLLALCGLGSLCFHLTLSQPMQVFDETGMIFSVASFFYIQYTLLYPQANKIKLISFIVGYIMLFVFFYCIFIETPIYQHTVFGLSFYSTIYYGFKLKSLYANRHYYWTLIFSQHFGFLLWNIDKHYCDQLILLRNQVPQFIAPIFQLHALWHLFMGFGSYVSLVSLTGIYFSVKHKQTLKISFHPIAGLLLETPKLIGNTKRDNLSHLNHSEKNLSNSQSKSEHQNGNSKRRNNLFNTSINNNNFVEINNEKSSP